ncbi:alpha/beta hydrolase [Bacillus marinisedimentorum]|uniref:alpha/beta hydrolase n=1 Tax=Bacillus marinisedimentorum TaxID=1821260 RepID=UPI000873305B|nr:alpha/beta fold hydrolase [Bacillus marinisedimentorum]
MIGCLLIHGFTGAPYEVEPLADHFRKTTDWKVDVPTLPGHGEEEEWDGVVHNDWIDTAEKAFLKLYEECDVVYVVGFSMGGMIAGYLASKYPVDRLVLLSASAHYINLKQMAADILEMIKDAVKGGLKDNELFKRYKKKTGATPIRATIEFQKLVRKLRQELENISAPVLIIQGESDGLIPHKTASFLYESVSSEEKYVYYLPDSKHILLHGTDKEQIIELADSFLHGRLGNRSSGV